MKYSIVTCAYDNSDQFKNFLLSAMSQDYGGKYEVIVVDNGTPNSKIFDACYNFTVFGNGSLGYIRIDPAEKKATNITQGINLGAREAIGDFIVIIADSNVLLSYNLLSEIDKSIDQDTIITSTGCDVKLSPDGTKESEYDKTENKAIINRKFLSKLGWPKDPLDFNLDLIRHRHPKPHSTYDVYVVALDRMLFIKEGGYDESDHRWGLYHHLMVQKLCNKYKWKKLSNVRIVHQYHELHMGASSEDRYYSKQFEIMRCRRT